MIPILGLTGKARSGKDEAARLIRLTYPVQRVAFADKLKDFAALVLDIEVSWFHDPEQKEQLNPQLGKTHRQLLLEFGTKMREIDSAVWVHWADKRAQQLLSDGIGIVFTDVRYANEGLYIHGLGGLVVEIERPDETHPDDLVRRHPSENYAGPVDATIVNNGTLEQFRIQVVSLMEVLYGSPTQLAQLHDVIDAPTPG